jgi:hypothetical protein
VMLPDPVIRRHWGRYTGGYPRNFYQNMVCHPIT